MKQINKIYKILSEFYGRQGWWPIYNEKKEASVYGCNAPRNDNELFEIALGAIMTQSVAWKNVEKALLNLKKEKLLKLEEISKISHDELAPLIRPAGYYNQKALKIKNFISWLNGFSYDFKKIKKIETGLLRDELLSIKGVGPETADSILLYAFRRKIFVVDAYTRRILTRVGIFSGNEKYHDIQKYFHDTFEGEIVDYNEYHALIVQHGKDVCRSKPRCEQCCLRRKCFF